MSNPDSDTGPRMLRLPTPPDPSPTLIELLNLNHKQWHVFFNDKGFHNHTSHTLLALHAMGAPPSNLKASYEHTVVYQRALFDSPNEVNEGNWKSFLGDGRYYSSYLNFFKSEVVKRGVQELLEHYIISEGANLSSGVSDTEPRMLSRLYESLQHPLIQVGYALEFMKEPMSNVPREDIKNGVTNNGASSELPPVAKLVLIEALAQTAVHKAGSAKLLPAKLFTSNKETTTSSPGPVHALTILARVMSDPALGGWKSSGPFGDGYAEVVSEFGDVIYHLVDAWIGNGGEALDENSPNSSKAFVQKKVQEVIWAVTLIYGVVGYHLGKETSAKFGFIANFVFAHFVTGSYFLPAFAEHLSPRSTILVLRGYFSSVLCVWIRCGRPGFNKDTLKAFFEDESLLTELEAGVGLDGQTESSESISQEQTWDRINATSIQHLDEHVPKLQRSLKYFASQFWEAGKVYSTGKEGTIGDLNTQVELEGAEYIDGSLFLRTAVLSARRIGTMDNLDEHNNSQQRHENTFVWDLPL